MPVLAEQICAAWYRRDALHKSENDTYRLFHGYQEGRSGLEIDRYGDIAVIANHGPGTDDFVEAADALCTLHSFRCVIGKAHRVAPYALIGELPTEVVVVHEQGAAYEVEVFASRNPGLYLDARPARAWLMKHSQDCRVLNLFSYTGSLGVAAMVGGARSVTHVDTQKRALRRCQANHRRNGQFIDPRDLACKDVPRFLRDCARGKRRFDGVIVDPPPYTFVSKRSARNLHAIGLSRSALATLNEGGWMLCFFHHDSRSWDELEASVRDACDRSLETVWRSQSGSDFPEEDERRVLRLSVFR